jgi:ubiquinone/menaquinone biosynthesis C-methylase UbiE
MDASLHAVLSALAPPPGRDGVPRYDHGWVLDGEEREPFLSYAPLDASVNWSDQLEALHEESSRTHFIDVWTRRAMLDRLPGLPTGATIVDLGCSTGYLLEDLARTRPHATLIGVDLVGAGLRKAHAAVPAARLLRADACALPLGDGTIDGIVSANLLEHVPDDRRALAEMARVLRRDATAVVVVPAGPETYDYYDRFLGHHRRYARGELAAKARDAGLQPVEDCYLGSLIFPAFWLVKQRNRRRYGALAGEALERRVAANIATTRDSGLGRLACRLERLLLDAGVRLPFGIRNLVVLRRC